jgi:ParB family transcriptional regulator, chromosome partitioning protein
MNTHAAATDLKYMAAKELVQASNIRQTASPKDDAEMKASILAQGGVQQNLIGAPRKTDGKIAVFAGGRRLANVMALIADGKLADDFEVPVMVRSDIDPDSPEAIEIALTENVVRAAMDYMDECNAMLMLSASGRSDEDIASSFDYRPRTVRERLLIATLVPEAQELVRSKERNLEWARALTIADKAMQKKVCDDIAANAGAWKTGDDIRTYLTKSTIEAKNALFNVEDYDGVIVSDFFEGDKFADVEKFWELQNEAIQDRVVDLEADGYGRGVHVLHEPFEEWRFEEVDDKVEAMAFIEVMPNGKVREITGVKPITEEASGAEGTLSAADEAASQDVFSADIAPFEVRATPRICEYAAAQRSAMLQARMAGDFRASLEYTVLAFLGHRSATFGANPFQVPGKDAIKTGEAFAARSDILHSINELTEFSADEADVSTREAMQVSIVRQMDDQSLQQLFTLLVSQRTGQQKRTALDDADDALSNIFGEGINIRDFWSPDETFFEMMASEDLRRLATEFLPGASATRFANSKRKNLVRALSDAFAQAQDGAMASSLAERLNTWVPGVMSFPAQVVTNADIETDVFDDADIEGSIFDDVAA